MPIMQLKFIKIKRGSCFLKRHLNSFLFFELFSSYFSLNVKIEPKSRNKNWLLA